MIVRVVDDTMNQPLEGAKVLILAAGISPAQRVSKKACVEQIQYGQAYDCKLPVGTQPVTHTIAADTDDVVFITVARTAELFEPAFQLLNSDGQGVRNTGGYPAS
jgi:hypothetical protein